jgi:hypothetical protein
MNFLGIGGFEILVIALVAFLVLGPKKMAEAGKTAAKILSQLRKQRDELTAALLDEPGKGTPGASGEGSGGRSVPRGDEADDDFPGDPLGASLREPIRGTDASSHRPDSDGQSAAPRS